MLRIPWVTWIANAAAASAGTCGDVTLQAEAANRSRQAIYDHAHKVQAAVEGAHDGGPTRDTLIAEEQRLAQEDARPWGRLEEAIEFPPDKPREFSGTAVAMGLSLNQVLVPLDLLPGKMAAPSRSTRHRRIRAATLAAGRAPKALDARCRSLVLIGGLDEIFLHGRPVPAGVEPASMAWSLGQEADDRSGAARAKALRGWAALSYVTADAGSGSRVGIAAVRRERRENGQPSLEDGLDVSHAAYEARRVLRPSRARVERLWERAEVADRRSSSRNDRARMPGAWRSRRVAPGRRPRRPSRSRSDPKRAGRWPTGRRRRSAPRVS